jgi:uncharacterized protein YggE
MIRTKALGIAVGLAVLLATVAVACGNDDDADETGAGSSPAGTVAGASVGAAAGGPSLAELALVRAAAGGTSQSGIWVTGQSSVTLEPDLALLNIGVETFAPTVAQARGDAATAMDAIVAVLRARNVEDTDIQTRSFNISPQYEFTEVLQGGVRTSKRVLVGYRVNNSAAIKIRDLDAVGSIIDEVAAAGGDSTRIDGISFTVDDTEVFADQLREGAVQDALAKAQQFATLTGVSLGQLVFITESGGGSPVVRDLGVESFVVRAQAAPPPTSIGGGELELRMSVQAVFSIQ